MALERNERYDGISMSALLNQEDNISHLHKQRDSIPIPGFKTIYEEVANNKKRGGYFNTKQPAP